MAAIQTRAVQTLLDTLDLEGQGAVDLSLLAKAFLKLGTQEKDLKILRDASVDKVPIDSVVARCWKSLRKTQRPPKVSWTGMAPTLSKCAKGDESWTAALDVISDQGDTSLGHPLRGISVAHLATSLREEVLNFGMSCAATIYDIEEPIILRKSGDVRCPRDGQMGSAYIDAISGPNEAGLATLMLSYTWGYSVQDVQDSLLDFCKRFDLTPERTYVWICCFCINQHKVRAASSVGRTIPFEEFQKEFGFRVRKVNHLVALMSPWDKPNYLKRVWCDFELYTAITEEVAVSIIMPPAQTTSYHHAICEESGIDMMWKHFGNVRIQEAEASVKQDRNRILNIIRAGPGFDKLNSVVVKHLQHWMVSSSEAYLQECFASGDARATAPSTLKLCRRVNNLLRNMGHFKSAAAIVEQALEACHRVGMGEQATVAELLRQLGILRRKQKDLEAAERAFMEAWRIHEVTDTLETPDGALLMLELGITSLERNDLQSAHTALVGGKAIAKKIGVLDGNLGGLFYRHHSTLHLMLGNLDEAEKELQNAQSVYERTGHMGSPAGANLQMCMGRIRHQRGELTEALKCYVRAQRIRERTGTSETPEAQEVKRCINTLEVELGSELHNRIISQASHRN